MILLADRDPASGENKSMSAAEIPDGYRQLLEAPLYGVLATVRPDGTAQANPMWFELVDDTLRFTHTTVRAKYRNLQHNPSMSLAVYDPAEPLKYIEVPGRLIDVLPDPDAAYFRHLAARYGHSEFGVPGDAPHRVALVMSMESFTTQ